MLLPPRQGVNAAAMAFVGQAVPVTTARLDVLSAPVAVLHTKLGVLQSQPLEEGPHAMSTAKPARLGRTAGRAAEVQATVPITWTVTVQHSMW